MSVSALELDAARSALDAFGLPADARIDFVKYRENHVYRVRSGDLDLALRMHRPGYRSDEELGAEVTAMVAFRAAGIAVPESRRTADGREVAVIVDAAGTRRQATMLGWFDGTTPMGDSGAAFLGEERPSRLRELGRLMAQLHASAEQLDPTLGADRAAWDAAGLVGPAALWGSPTLSASLDDAGHATLAAAEARLAEDLARLPRDAARFGYIHADLTLENVLVGPDGLVAIDFDDSGRGWFLFDLVTTYLWCARHPDAGGLLAELVGGYLELRPLDAVDAAAWDPLLLARALSYLGWSAARPGDPVSEFHEEWLVPWVVAAAERYVTDGRTGWPGLHAFIASEER